MSVISFDPLKGEQMRFGEYTHLGDAFWNFGEIPTVLNAWQIGNRRFVLTFGKGYQAFQVTLMEIVPGIGLRPVGLSFGAGA